MYLAIVVHIVYKQSYSRTCTCTLNASTEHSCIITQMSDVYMYNSTEYMHIHIYRHFYNYMCIYIAYSYILQVYNYTCTCTVIHTHTYGIYDPFKCKVRFIIYTRTKNFMRIPLKLKKKHYLGNGLVLESNSSSSQAKPYSTA